MAIENWKVKLFVVNSPADEKSSGRAAEFKEVFGVQASGTDQARKAARKWLEDRGYKVRSVNFTSEVRELVAYVMPKA